MKNEPLFPFTAAVIFLGVIAAFANPVTELPVNPVPVAAVPALANLTTPPDTAPAPALATDKPHRHHHLVQKS